jgi:hypothetical protein
MKVEIGESLCASWLKHVKGCQIVQTNWKTPSLENGLDNEKLIKQIFDKYRHKYKDEIGYNEMFGNNEYLQLLRQSEVDVIGIDLSGDKNRIITLDVAFHEGGLNYGSKVETSARILKKFIRTALTLIGVCKCKEAELYFISPKISKSLLEVLNPLVISLNESFKEINDIDFKFYLICNGEFEKRILKKVIIESNSISDTSELFMRSIKLIKLSLPDMFSEIRDNDFEDLKIGKLVQETLKELIKNNKLTQIELNNLCNVKYCAETFGFSGNQPFLKKVKEDVVIERFDNNGISRFYVDTIDNNNSKYLLSNQWFEKNRSKYLKWHKKFE